MTMRMTGGCPLEYGAPTAYVLELYIVVTLQAKTMTNSRRRNLEITVSSDVIDVVRHPSYLR